MFQSFPLQICKAFEFKFKLKFLAIWGYTILISTLKLRSKILNFKRFHWKPIKLVNFSLQLTKLSVDSTSLFVRQSSFSIEIFWSLKRLENLCVGSQFRNPKIFRFRLPSLAQIKIMNLWKARNQLIFNSHCGRQNCELEFRSQPLEI